MASFKLFAGTNVGLRENNEDNFTVCPDLSEGQWVVPSDSQEIISLGQYGCLLVVADGMGGQNAGEVASAIAIDTVRDMFSLDNLKAVAPKGDSLRSYLKKVIVEADRRVKFQSSQNVGMSGMGSTIVLVWLIDGMAHVAWLGDSRAYSIIPGKGISRLTKDHSYVQNLVDSGLLTEEEAMNHPDSNIITKSLGDISNVAKPDCASYPIYDQEVILLCSDGLCGVCTDSEIEKFVSANKDDLKVCKEALTDAALSDGSTDNITIALVQVFSENGFPEASPEIDICDRHFSRKRLLSLLIPTVVCAGLATLLLCIAKGRNTESLTALTLDSTKIMPGDSVRFHISGKSDKLQLRCDCDLLSVLGNDSMVVYSGRILESGDSAVKLRLVNRKGVEIDSFQVVLCTVQKAVQKNKPTITPIEQQNDKDASPEESVPGGSDGTMGFGDWDNPNLVNKVSPTRAKDQKNVNPKPVPDPVENNSTASGDASTDDTNV